MHLFIELVVIAAFVAAMAHAVARFGLKPGLVYAGALLWLGVAREAFVVIGDYLYGFAPLTFEIGRLPLVAALIWGFCIHAAVVFAEVVTGESLVESLVPTRRYGGLELRPSAVFLVATAVFLESLACFFEPFLKLIGMARWEAGTRTLLDIPWIALVGYPTMALLFLPLFAATARAVTGRRLVSSLAIRVGFVGVAHAWALQGLKRALGW